MHDWTSDTGNAIWFEELYVFGIHANELDE